jgi:hypothetical protein
VVDLIEEAFRLQTFLENHHCAFCFIGGIAVQRWGEPRLTRDIDLSLLTEFGTEAILVDLLLSAYQPRIADARAFALTHLCCSQAASASGSMCHWQLCLMKN